MLPYRDSRLTYIALGVFFLIVLSYAYYEARGALFGPSISVTSEVTEVHDPFITIRGKADRIASLSMNGKEIPVTENGAFEEPYLLAEGYNHILLEAKDKYGRRSSQKIEIVYSPSPAGAKPAAATLTPQSESTSVTNPTDEAFLSTMAE
jgi:RecB family exonuclease